MRRETKQQRHGRRIIGYNVYANCRDGQGHRVVIHRKSSMAANNDVARMTNGKNAGSYSKPMAIPVFA